LTAVGEHEDGASKRKEAKLTQGTLVTAKTSSIPQTKVDELITNYIVTEMRPICTVEKASFIELVTELAPSRTVPCRKTMSVRINTNYTAMLSDLKSVLSAVSHVCTTADIWSSHNRSYMGMTVHWIADAYIRKSATISCRRFTGAHTYDRIAEVISAVHADFDLPLDKITSTVTDNASNFAKAFSSFPAPDEDEPPTDIGDMDDDDIQHVIVCDLLNSASSSQSNDTEYEHSDVYLPPHNRCAAHTLNLIATTDADTALVDKAYSRIHHGSFGKCQALWNAVHRSSKASDAVKEICPDKILICPCPTRWNSKFDAVHRLLELADKLPAVCDALSIARLKPPELDFLREYDTVMQPLAATLDTLQGDINCFYGMLLPKLIQMRNKLISIETGSQRELIYAKPLISAILAGVSRRYGDLLELRTTSKDAIVAAVSHPQYKLRWVPPDRKEEVTNIFVSAVSSAACKAAPHTSEPTTASDDDDYGYGPSSNSSQTDSVAATSNSMQENRGKIEALNYLDDRSKELNSLNSFGYVRATFIKYNTTLPSSAPVERLFSIGGLILTPRRNKLSDVMFEKLLMLKTNAQLLLNANKKK
jgi:hypothetical protein